MITRSVDAAAVPTRSGWLRVLLHPGFVPGVILAGLAGRLLVAILLPVEPLSDAAWYAGRAKEIAAGMGYQESGFPTAYWPIGWPAILAGAYLVFGSIAHAVLVLNLTAAFATMYLVLWFGRRIAGQEVVGRVALLAYAAYPNHIAYTGTVVTEPVYTALAMAAFAAMIHGRSRFWLLVASGLMFGAATLVKPQTLAFPFGAAVALALVYPAYAWKSALRAGLLVYAGLLLVVTPWTARNFAVFGEPVLVSTNGGVALHLGANEQVKGTHFDYEKTPVFQQLGVPWSDRVKRQVELDRLNKDAALAWIREHPGSYLAWMPKKALLLWIKDTEGFWAFDHSYPAATPVVRTLQIANQVYYLAILLLALGCAAAAFYGLWRQDPETARLGLLFCMPIFVTLLAAVFTGQTRYHFPAMPYLIVAAAWTWSRLLRVPDRAT